MGVKVGINGFGRIGRNIFRAISEDPIFTDIEVVGVNDLTDNKTMGHLLKYDSVMGTFGSEVQVEENSFIVDGNVIPVTGHRQPKDIPWAEMGAEYVLECTGLQRLMHNELSGTSGTGYPQQLWHQARSGDNDSCLYR